MRLAAILLAAILATAAIAADCPCAIRHCPAGQRCRPAPPACPECPPAAVTPCTPVPCAAVPCLAVPCTPPVPPGEPDGALDGADAVPPLPVPPAASQAPASGSGPGTPLNNPPDAAAAAGRWVLPLTALRLHGEYAGGAGLGYRWPGGIEVLGHLLGGPAVECRGVSLAVGGDDADDHEAHGRPQRAAATVDCPGCTSSKWGAAITLVIPLGHGK